MKKLPLWIRSVLRLAQWHEPDSDRSSRGRHSELPTWLLPDFLFSLTEAAMTGLCSEAWQFTFLSYLKHWFIFLIYK